ncbi:exopolysaccharide biosynthesis protein [Rhizobiaceae bacterium BDR2-2]|uniref:Exopolysaccharide biosynthesis protein n=1 Tax=Ectorhizobium quercum TaxID=2965071 RepID=A0AAE3SV15_9HYPH|nr:exopolysaccharide biosynthesis protein [Ectorhizobium quercum]MCX8997850.1 exopolysaccharide biosynthesis protein [Ectorhizobium quercum]
MSLNIQFKDTSRKTSEVLEDILNEIKTDRITLRDLMAMIGEQGLLLLCALLSLPFLFPVSIPGVSTVFGAGIVLIAIAITINRLPWLPNFVANRQLDTAKLVPVLNRGINFLRRIDRYLKPRFLYFTTGMVANRLNGLALTFAGALLMLPLSFIPFSNTLPGVAILLLSTGISQRDGLLVACGYVMIGLTVIYFGGLAWLIWATGTSFEIPGFG